MQLNKLELLSFCVFTVIVLITFLIQSSLYIFNATPQMWIAVTVYFSVYKRSLPAILMIYLISMIYASSTSMAFGKILCMNVVIYLIAWTMRAFNLKNIKILALIYTGFIFLLPAIDWILSVFIPSHLLRSYSFLNWISTSIFTALWMVLMTPLFIKMDSWMIHLLRQKEFMQ